MTEYVSQCARDAAEGGYGDSDYHAYLDRVALGYAKRFPDRAEYYLSRSLSEALSGNDGD